MARERRLVFGEVADTYDRVRPSYPDALFDALFETAGLRAGDPVLEVGAGSGKATRSLVARGLAVTAYEPSEPMAEVLGGACPTVTVVPRGFDEGDAPTARHRAVVAAQSWHWVTPGVRTDRAAAALRPGGWVVVWWNRPAPRDDEVRHALDAAYAAEAPELVAHSYNRIPAPDRVLPRDAEHAAATEFDTSARFGSVVVRQFPWQQWYSTADYLALLTTYSDHRLLADHARARLLDAVAAVLDARGGGIDHGYVTDFIAAPLS